MKLKTVCRNSSGILLFLAMVSQGKTQTPSSYTLEYKWKPGEKLQYKVERHDSSNNSFGGQSMPMKMTMHQLNSVTVQKASSGNTFTVLMKTDSAWTDPDMASFNSGARSGSAPSAGGAESGAGSGTVVIRGGGSGGGMRGGPGGRMDRTVDIDARGRSSDGQTRLAAYLIPLPEKPVAVNDTWDFESVSEEKGRREGKTTIKGQCLLYTVEKVQNDLVATIIVNEESKSQGKMNMRSPQGEISGTFSSASTGTGLVYFNITKGRVDEVVAEETRESQTESTMMSGTSSSTSKSTVRLTSR